MALFASWVALLGFAVHALTRAPSPLSFLGVLAVAVLALVTLAALVSPGHVRLDDSGLVVGDWSCPWEAIDRVETSFSFRTGTRVHVYASSVPDAPGDSLGSYDHGDCDVAIGGFWLCGVRGADVAEMIRRRSEESRSSSAGL